MILFQFFSYRFLFFPLYCCWDFVSPAVRWWWPTVWMCLWKLWVCFGTIEARIGRKSVAVAMLLAHSVNMATRRQRMAAMAQGGMEWSGVIWLPSQWDRPDSCQHTNTHILCVMCRITSCLCEENKIKEAFLLRHHWTVNTPSAL